MRAGTRAVALVEAARVAVTGARTPGQFVLAGRGAAIAVGSVAVVALFAGFDGSIAARPVGDHRHARVCARGIATCRAAPRRVAGPSHVHAATAIDRDRRAAVVAATAEEDVPGDGPARRELGGEGVVR